MNSPFVSPMDRNDASLPSKPKTLSNTLKRSTSSVLTRAKSITKQFGFKRKLPQWGSPDHNGLPSDASSPAIVTSKTYEPTVKRVENNSNLDLSGHLGTLGLDSPNLDHSQLAQNTYSISQPSTFVQHSRETVTGSSSPSFSLSQTKTHQKSGIYSPATSFTSLNNDSANSKPLKHHNLYINVEKSQSGFSLQERPSPVVPTISPYPTPKITPTAQFTPVLSSSLSMPQITAVFPSPSIPVQSPARAASLRQKGRSSASTLTPPVKPTSSTVESSSRAGHGYFNSKGDVGLNIMMNSPDNSYGYDTYTRLPVFPLPMPSPSPSPSPSRYSFTREEPFNNPHTLKIAPVQPLSINNNKSVDRPQLPPRAISRPSVHNNWSAEAVKPGLPLSPPIPNLTSTISPPSKKNGQHSIKSLGENIKMMRSRSLLSRTKSKLGSLSKSRSNSVSNVNSVSPDEPPSSKQTSATSLPTLNSVIRSINQTSEQKTHRRGGASKFWPFGSSDDVSSLSNTNSSFSSRSSSYSGARRAIVSLNSTPVSAVKSDISKPVDFSSTQYQEAPTTQFATVHITPEGGSQPSLISSPSSTAPAVSPTKNKRFSEYSDTLSMLSLPTSSKSTVKPQRPQRPDVPVSSEIAVPPTTSAETLNERRFNAVNKEHANRLAQLLNNSSKIHCAVGRSPDLVQHSGLSPLAISAPGSANRSTPPSTAHTSGRGIERQASVDSMFSSWTVPPAEFVEQHNWLNESDNSVSNLDQSYNGHAMGSLSALGGSGWSPTSPSHRNSTSGLPSPTINSNLVQYPLNRRSSSLLPSPVMYASGGGGEVTLDGVIEEKAVEEGWF